MLALVSQGPLKPMPRVARETRRDARPRTGNSRVLLILFAVAISTIFLLGSSSAKAVQCEDGWQSPSDGGPGTCSWHGGVKDTVYTRDSTESVWDKFRGFEATEMEIWFGILVLSILGVVSGKDAVVGVSFLVALFSAWQIIVLSGLLG